MPLLPDSTDLASTSDADLKLFVGENWQDYEGFWRMMRYKEMEPFMVRLKKTNWLCLLMPPIWFLYRKMYLLFSLFFALIFMVAYMLDAFGIHLPWVMYAVAAAAASRYLYIWHAAEQIKKIRRQESDMAAANARIAATGGVSAVGAYVGLFFLSVFIAVVLYGTMQSMNKSTLPRMESGAAAVSTTAE